MSTPLFFPIDYYCSVGALTFFLAHMQHYAAKKSFSPFRTLAALHAAAVFITEKLFSPYCYSCQASRFTICYSIFSISPLFHLSICTLKSHAQPLCLDFNLLKIHLALTLVAKQQKLRRFLKGNLISFGRFKFLTFRKKEDFFFISL